MGKEIEHKFLVKKELFRPTVTPVFFQQGYLSTEPGRTVRVRIEGTTGKLTIKGRNNGIVRTEFEYEIPLDEAAYMLENMCIKPTISKYRYRIAQGDLCWEVDVFEGDNKGLIIAELEVPEVDTKFETPEWVGEEVSGDHRYYNSYLIANPFNKWK